MLVNPNFLGVPNGHGALPRKLFAMNQKFRVTLFVPRKGIDREVSFSIHCYAECRVTWSKSVNVNDVCRSWIFSCNFLACCHKSNVDVKIDFYREKKITRISVKNSA